MKTLRKPWYEQPAPKVPDIRDAEEHAAIADALAVLPDEHPARQAYAEGAATIKLTHLVADRPDIVKALTEAYRAGNRRCLERSAHFRP